MLLELLKTFLLDAINWQCNGNSGFRNEKVVQQRGCGYTISYVAYRIARKFDGELNLAF